MASFLNEETGEQKKCCVLEASPLHKAVLERDTKLVEELVLSGEDINRIFQTIPPIYIAAKCNDLNVLKTLIKLKCDINATTLEVGHTALHAAVSDSFIEFAEFLVRNGANINQKDNDGATPLMIASGSGLMPMLESLVRNGADVNIPTKRGLSPLAVAVQNGHREIVEFLINCAANVNYLDTKGNNALLHAVKSGDLAICRMLIQAGSDVDNANHETERPINIAAMYGNSPIVELLIDAGCDINAASKNGTPVYSAVERQHVNVLQKLICAGADVGIETECQRLPFTEALHQHKPNDDIVFALLQAGTDIDSVVCSCHDSPINIIKPRCNLNIASILCQVDTKFGDMDISKLSELKQCCQQAYLEFSTYMESHKIISLKGQCRKVIKRAVGTVNYRRKIQTMDLPLSVQRYVLHDDVNVTPYECSKAEAVPLTVKNPSPQVNNLQKGFRAPMRRSEENQLFL